MLRITVGGGTGGSPARSSVSTTQFGQQQPLASDRFQVGYLSMERIFTAWQSSDGSQITLIAGEGPPVFANGEIQPDCDVMLWRIAAGSWEEAATIRNLRLGWGPYVPSGKAAPCPDCGSSYYPEGSGQCWNCEREA